MFTPVTTLLGLQPIALTSTVQNHPEGFIVEAQDPTFGGGEFIYLKGVASTVVGSMVTYDRSTTPPRFRRTRRISLSPLRSPCRRTWRLSGAGTRSRARR